MKMKIFVNGDVANAHNLVAFMGAIPHLEYNLSAALIRQRRPGLGLLQS